MANLGAFDPDLIGKLLFDAQLLPLALFDEDLAPGVASGIQVTCSIQSNSTVIGEATVSASVIDSRASGWVWPWIQRTIKKLVRTRIKESTVTIGKATITGEAIVQRNIIGSVASKSTATSTATISATETGCMVSGKFTVIINDEKLTQNFMVRRSTCRVRHRIAATATVEPFAHDYRKPQRADRKPQSVRWKDYANGAVIISSRIAARVESTTMVKPESAEGDDIAAICALLDIL